jgi:DNA-binding CsgD family transcriptional regulator
MVRVLPYLLERQVELQMLGTAVERAGAGRGSAVLVSGEAGIGKTSLVHAFLAAAAGRARVLAGACEDLHTPRALGPLGDAARSAADGPLAAALSPRADPDLVFAAACDELASPPSPAVLAVEDAHWADDATLDVLRYLGTRVQNLPAVLLVTYRDDALARDHPLRGVLGVLGSTAATRLRLTRLTLDAVREMAASTDIDPGELSRLTGGNPFFVTEVLDNPSVGVPPTVVDAVLARVRTLSLSAQTALDRLAVIPSGAELDLLRVLCGDRLRDLGVARRPRQPQPGTLTNPAGLTDRQLEILRLAATGLSNAEIAQRLVVSPRTVDHHVSAILQKLGVRTRRDATAWAAQLESKPSSRGLT